MALTRRGAPPTLVRAAALVISLVTACARADDYLVNMTGQVTVFWGRHKDEGSLREACDSGMYTMVIMSFLDVYGGGGGYHLDLSGHPLAGAGADIKHCQSSGVLVSLAIGGFGGAYSLPTKQSALDLFDHLWNAYLGGSKPGVDRPLGDAWLDGVDLYLEHGAPSESEHYEALAKELAARNGGGPGPAGKPLHLTATPHCAIPDRFVKRALATGLFERIHVRFYDDEDCGYRFQSQWERWTAAYPASRVYYGLLASEEQSVDYWIYPKDLYYGVMPVIQRAANYGGVMIWDRYYDRRSNYSSYVKYWA